MPQATGDAIRDAVQSESFNTAWASATDQVKAGVTANLPDVSIEVNQEALVSAISQALIEQGIEEGQIPDLTQAVAGKVKEQLDAQLTTAQQTLKAGLGQAAEAGVDAMGQAGKQVAAGTIETIAASVQETMNEKVQEMAGLMSQAQQLTTEMIAMIEQINGMIEQIGGVDALKQVTHYI